MNNRGRNNILLIPLLPQIIDIIRSPYWNIGELIYGNKNPWLLLGRFMKLSMT